MRTKQYISLLLAALMMLTLTACGAALKKDKSTAMTIAPTQLSEEEAALAELLDLEMKAYRIFDFQVSSAKSIKISAYELLDNDWSSVHTANLDLGASTSDGAGRVALMFGRMNDGVSVRFQREGSGGGTQFVMPDGDGIGLFYATSTLTATTDVELDQEIPLAVQIATTQNEINSCDVQYFGMPRELAKNGYEHVYAITVTFRSSPVSDNTQSVPTEPSPAPAN